MEVVMRRFALALALLSSPAAFAQPAGAQAETLFRQGRDLMTAGKTAEACTSFQESEKLEPAVTTLLNLAGCREKLGQLATAWGQFLEAERQTRSATTASDRQLHDIAKKRAATLEPRVSKLEIDVPDANKQDGLEIKRGDEAIDAGAWNRALPVDGGTYTITATAPGSKPWSTQLTIAAEHDSKKIEIPKLEPAPQQPATPAGPTNPTGPTAPPPPPIMPASRPSRTVPIVVGAGAVVLLGGSLAFDLWGDSTYNDAKAEMTSQSRRTSLYDSANTKRYAAIGFGVGGVAAAGVAVWLFLRAGHDDAASERTVRIVPSPTGIAIVGSY
jgi:hypothetical protein